MSTAAPSMDSQLPAIAQRALELFRGPLRDVRFPDVDADSLEAVSTSALEAMSAVEAAERALEAARSQLAIKTREVIAKSELGLAYARIYARTDEALSRQLDEPSQAPILVASEPVAAKRRGRPRKQAEGASPQADIVDEPSPSNEKPAVAAE
ncbi:MAG: hypothetical protein U0271_19315 [Polyangiaceae bacterium]